MNDTPEMTIRASNTVALVAQTMRQIGLVGGGFVTIASALRHHDIDAMIEWMQGDATLPFITAVATLGIMAAGWVRTVLAKRCLLRAARTDPAKVVLS